MYLHSWLYYGTDLSQVHTASNYLSMPNYRKLRVTSWYCRNKRTAQSRAKFDNSALSIVLPKTNRCMVILNYFLGPSKDSSRLPLGPGPILDSSCSIYKVVASLPCLQDMKRSRSTTPMPEKKKTVRWVLDECCICPSPIGNKCPGKRVANFSTSTNPCQPCHYSRNACDRKPKLPCGKSELVQLSSNSCLMENKVPPSWVRNPKINHLNQQPPKQIAAVQSWV